MKRFLLMCLCGVMHAAAESPPMLPLVAIQPLGAFKAADIQQVKSAIEARYEVSVEVLPESPLPGSAYYKPRDRYKADLLLDSLEARKPERFAKIVGLTVRDVSITNDEGNDWGIFGLGQLGGDACVVSTFRLRAGKADNALFSARLAKVVNHELGHTFGLDHCPTVGCVMQAAGGKIATVDAATGKPCEKCSAALPLRPQP